MDDGDDVDVALGDFHFGVVIFEIGHGVDGCEARLTFALRVERAGPHQPVYAVLRLEVVGVMVSRDSRSDRCSHFCDHHKFRVGEDRLLIPLGFGGMVNHSLTPNLQKAFAGDRLYLEALRDLPADEELFFTYAPYAQEAFGLL